MSDESFPWQILVIVAIGVAIIMAYWDTFFKK